MTDIGTLCDECVAFMVPYYCYECGKRLEDGICYSVESGEDSTLLCEDCYRRKKNEENL